MNLDNVDIEPMLTFDSPWVEAIGEVIQLADFFDRLTEMLSFA